ncbi:HTH-type transcriptional regulator YfmP [Desulfosporosinus acididurans]|uniref:HTH-type transcriptional regulator YfmP n=1 Tax=Desulfosporosinus acididurans TaxID=476652 RepID=A0A0J1FT02_9FIRM|nr:MerR family transcriptional regulator [Desulfosporosinus acididurans]KLU66599.1 HTH-type transcriptional regulator YfmP [Desulfosporosinus acididurans]
MDNYKIDQVALQSGLTKRTIRYYEEIGILPPPKRSEGGTRYYNEEHIELLKRIKYTKDALGLSLEELQHFIALSNLIESQKVSFKQTAERREQREKLLSIIDTLDEELILIEQKILKIERVKEDLTNLKKRAQAVIEKINLEEVK